MMNPLKHRPTTLSSIVVLAMAMLAAAGTGLSAQTQAKFRPPVDIELPALVEVGASSWLHASIPGLEVLSLTSAESTRILVQNIAAQRANLDAILPPELRISWQRPMTILLYGMENPKPLPAEFADILSKKYTEKERERAVENRESKPLDVTVNTTIGPGSWANDIDSICVFNLVSPRLKVGELSQLPASVFVTSLVQSRMPPLPAWFVEGLSIFYAQATLTGSDLDYAPAVWISPAQTLLLIKDRSMPAEFLPLTEVFAHVNTSTIPDDERRRQLLRSQATLLVRWVFEGKAPGGKEALWTFVQGNTAGPEGEARFRECFGITVDVALARLREYLPGALRKPMRVRLERESRLPQVEIRPAQPAEVARIQGEWERLAIRLVTAAQPELRDVYVAHAQRTLAQGPDDASADPELLAARGLLAVDLKEDARALPLLEAACATGQPRPRAVVELARIRLARAKEALVAGAKLEASEVARIIGPLRQVLDARPPMGRAYIVLAETLAASAEPPSAQDLELVRQGLRLFPGDVTWVVTAVRLFIDLGLIDDARTAIDAGLDYVSDDSGRRRLYAIRSAVRAAAPK